MTSIYLCYALVNKWSLSLCAEFVRKGVGGVDREGSHKPFSRNLWSAKILWGRRPIRLKGPNLLTNYLWICFLICHWKISIGGSFFFFWLGNSSILCNQFKGVSRPPSSHINKHKHLASSLWPIPRSYYMNAPYIYRETLVNCPNFELSTKKFGQYNQLSL